MKYKRTNVLHITNGVRQDVQKRKLLHSYSSLLITFSGGQDSAFCLLILYLLQNRTRLEWCFTYLRSAQVRKTCPQNNWPEQHFCDISRLGNFLFERFSAIVITKFCKSEAFVETAKQNKSSVFVRQQSSGNLIKLPLLSSVEAKGSIGLFLKKDSPELALCTNKPLQKLRFCKQLRSFGFDLALFQQYKIVPVMNFYSSVVQQKRIKNILIKQRLRSIPFYRCNEKQVEIKQIPCKSFAFASNSVPFIIKQFRDRPVSQILYASPKRLNKSQLLYFVSRRDKILSYDREELSKKQRLRPINISSNLKYSLINSKYIFLYLSGETLNFCIE